MPQTTEVRYSFNRGLISPLGLGRKDLERTSLSAETQNNWMPRVLGSMSIRPGLQYKGPTYLNRLAKNIPFVFSSDDTAVIELTDSLMLVRVNEIFISRDTVSAAVSNGTFNSDLTGWADADESGGTSAWLAGGYMSLTGSGFNRAIRTQTLTVVAGTEHALRIVIARGPVVFRLGSSSGGDEYIRETKLGTGTHSLAFTPTGTSAYIHLSSRLQRPVLVDSVVVESNAVMALPTPWGPNDLSMVRYTPSGDVIYIACDGFQQRKIERRGTHSWSIVLYEPEDGPFRVENVESITIAASAISGDVTLTASNPIFRSTHVGALFSIESVGQLVTASLTGENQFTDEIRVTGVGPTRAFAIAITGVWNATITLQRSVGEPGSWTDVNIYVANTTVAYNDTLDNQIIYYRIGIKTGGYVSGTADVILSYSTGSIRGIARVTAYTNGTTVTAAVLKHLGGTTATEVWAEGDWSPYRGYPTANALYEGRLWWGGRDRVWGSVSDAYEGFDPLVEGDSGPISRSIGEGPIDRINWMIALQRLVISTSGREWGAKSSSFDEALTPTAFGLKKVSTQGSAKVAAVEVDVEGLFVQRSGTRVHQLTYDANLYNYSTIDMTALVPELGDPGITMMAVQQKPDTRVHCVRSDGIVMVLVYDKVENVRCWVTVETDGSVEDVVVLPGSVEDSVYYIVNRTIGGSTVRYFEKWSLESECRGDSICKLMDSSLTRSGAPSATFSGLAHLEGKVVAAWGDGIDLGTYTVSSGSIALSQAVSDVTVGLPYTADYESTKLGNLVKIKRINHIGLLLADAHAQGIQYGPDFDNLSDLPLIDEGAPIDVDEVSTHFQPDVIEFDGTYGVDTRVCLRASSPRPMTVLALTMEFESA